MLFCFSLLKAENQKLKANTMTELILKAEKREKLGSNNTKRLLKSGFLPIVVYGPDKKNIDLQIQYSEFIKAYKEAGENTIISLDVDDKKIHVFIHDVQVNPLNNTIVHADFYQFSKDHKLKSEVPIHFIGESLAVKEKGGILLKDTDHIEVECLPNDMPHFIEVDLSKLEDINDIIYVSDLKVDKNVQILSGLDQVIASVQAVREEKVEEVEAPKAEEEKENSEETEEKEESQEKK